MEFANLTLLLEENYSLEEVIGQLQKTTDKILCVINGSYFSFFQSLEDIPNSLENDTISRNKKIGIVMYGYRCRVTDCYYTFFLKNVDEYLKEVIDRVIVGRSIKISKTKDNGMFVKSRK